MTKIHLKNEIRDIYKSTVNCGIKLNIRTFKTNPCFIKPDGEK